MPEDEGRTHDFDSSNNHRSVLYDAIYSYLESVGEGFHEDFVRAFFRLKVHDLGGLLPHVVEIIPKASHEFTPG